MISKKEPQWRFNLFSYNRLFMKEINNSLRIIGIQIFDKTDPCVKKSLEPGWYPFIKCVNDEEVGDNLNVYPIPDYNVCPPNYFTIDYDNENLPFVNISAIVGKNGFGKSSLLDIMYGILNNFAESLLTDKGDVHCKFLSHAYGINARLHFELDGVRKYINLDDGSDLYFEIVNDNPRKVNIRDLDLDGRKEILKDFFYTISVNYSLYAFNPEDRESLRHLRPAALYNADWLYNLFHKNDGYYVPIVLTPFRASSGNINISKENRLAAHRLSILSLLFQSQAHYFLKDYKVEEISYKFNSRYLDLKLENYRYEHCPSELKDVIDQIISSFIKLWRPFLEEEVEGYILSADEAHRNTELFYLGYKTARICLTYPTYQQMFGFDDLISLATDKYIDDNLNPGEIKLARDADGTVLKSVSVDVAKKWLDQRNEILKGIVKELYRTKDNHITAKLQQCLAYLKKDRYRDADGTLPVDDVLDGKVYTKYGDVMQLLPPAFIDYELHFKLTNDNSGNEPEITFKRMSSGERQMLNALSYVLYHMPYPPRCYTKH